MIQPFTCEEFKLLKVIGEKVVQVVSSSVDKLQCPASEVIKVEFELKNVTDHPFTDKIVKQGIIHKKILYCDTEGITRCQQVEVPFTAVADIEGVDPHDHLDVQNKLLLKETDFILMDCNRVDVKVVFELRIKVSTWVQRRLKVCTTNIINLFQISD